MPAFEIDPGLLADMKHQHAEISRLEASLQKTHEEITTLCEKLTHAQEALHSQRDAIADARHQFNEIAGSIDSPALRALLHHPGVAQSQSSPTSLPGPAQGPREKTQWVYSKLRRSERRQVDLCEMYSSEFGKPGQALITFLATSKFFRKTGSPGNFSWSISANRENDLREYLT